VAGAQITEPPRLTEGERWSRELLDALRERRFTPGAWGAFLGDALARSRAVRAGRPDVVRQSRRCGAAGLAAAAPFGAGPVAWCAVWWALIDWHLGMLETPDGDPRPLRAHDALTLARLWAAPVARRHPEPWLGAAALATDVADGALARRHGPTRLGRDFDSTADTLFLDQALRGAIEQRGLDPRLLTLERARLAIGAAVVCTAYFGRSEPPPPMGLRELAAALAGAGAVLAAAGRPRAAGPLLGAAIGYRALIRIRAPAASAPAGPASGAPPAEAPASS
jgi:phosphatidylglycerophosphate synthase